MRINRRTLLRAGIAGGVAACHLPTAPSRACLTPRLNHNHNHNPAAVKMGILADLHFGLCKSARARLEAFMAAVDLRKPDCLMQLGDFNYGDPESRRCMEVWQQFKGPTYHVLGNHDMDKRDKKQMLEQWEMPAPYYSFDRGAWHFVVLDRNHLYVDGKYIPYARANFYVDPAMRGFADERQLEWLRADLDATRKTTAIFVHQGLGMPAYDGEQPHPANRKIEQVLAEVNRQAGASKVAVVFCGHHHVDRYHYRDGIHYVWVNSASYNWVGAKYGRMADYRDALYCFAEFAEDGTVQIEGRQSEWVKPTPAERGVPNPERLNTWIRSRELKPGQSWNGARTAPTSQS